MNNIQTEFDNKHLFGNKLHSPVLDALLHECITSQRPLLISLTQSGAIFTLESISSNFLTITGRWRLREPTVDHSRTGMLILAPFMFLAEQILLPVDCLYTLGRTDRTVADFIMRNVFYAACRGENIIFNSTTSFFDANIRKTSFNLIKTYLWIARANLEEGILNRDNSPELIIANSHLPIIEFDNFLLESGATEYRKYYSPDNLSIHDDQMLEFRHLRNDIISLYKS